MNNSSFDTPDCFLPFDRSMMSLREKGKVEKCTYTYKNLSQWKFTKEEKLWLFNETLQVNHAREDQVFNKTKLLQRYEISRSFFQNNQKSFDNGDLKLRGREDGIRYYFLLIH